MPAIDPNTVLHISSIQLPSQGCCVPRRKTLAVSEPVRAALSALNETVMADMSARVLLELQKEYPLYAQNNILYAICLTVVMLVCYESLRNAAAAHAAAKHEEAFQLKQAHEHLMNRSRESLKSTLETSKAAVIASAAVSQVSLNQGLKASMDITEVVAQEVAEQLASKQEDRQSILTDASSKSHTTGLLYSPSPAPLLSALSITPSLVNMQATLSPSAPLRSSTFSGPLGRAATTSAMQALKQASGTVGKNGVLPGQLFDHDGDVTETLWK
ncbi:hypothetical protein BCR37DRAFT_24627 [Protomyces lactucae-debilis]|uniref:Uncharacterized protein n=1 Tax=Protomyces lactucae-debilis TaxID=2754530 RepID=A0A1Y2FFC6_PROLT|nr:uncharacterized protein BCR37DRAFT_24627 [Protomyces lactucae-debilis]ORY81996.1 hypothetical protein BCR37DRAFT_24627 [Protomyces lactucae-debilis]